MIKEKIVFLILFFFLLSNCSFDSKTGIWKGTEKEKKKISKIEKEQKRIIEIDKIYTSDNLFSKEKRLQKNIILSKPKKNSSWVMAGLNYQNYIGNNFLPNIDNNFLKKKIGKNKFSNSQATTSLLIDKGNIIFSDDVGTIFSINEYGKINWKKNIYKKIYKKIYKNLTLSIYNNNIYIADNLGFIYVINLNSGKLVWIKNYGIPLKSHIKVSDKKIFLLDQDNRIICLSTKDGAKIWDILSISSFIKSQDLLSLALSKNGNLISINSAADLFNINASTGEIYWSRNTSDSLFADDTDFFTSSGIVIADNEIIFSAQSSIFSFNITEGTINWKNEVNSIDTPIVDKKNIFLVTRNGYFVILNKDTGKIVSSSNVLKILKKRKQKTKVTRFIMGSGKLYTFTSNGYLIVSSASTGKFKYVKKIGEQINSAPIISDGKLFILSENSRIFGFN